MRNVYADCAASAPVLPQLWDVLRDRELGNPNATHFLGRKARTMLEAAREHIAECIGADKASEIAFTPSATEACRIAINVMNIGWCSPYEHKAVRDHVEFVRAYGVVDGDAFAHMLLNNETGERYDYEIKKDTTHNRVFTDATAAVGQIPINVKELGVEALAAGAHKFGGIPGIGFLYMKGGISDDDTFPGTPPVALAVAMSEALLFRTEHMYEDTERMQANIYRLGRDIMEIEGAHINTPIHAVRSILSVRFDGVNARELLVSLDSLGVFASAGAACSADADEPSRTLLASGLTEEQALSTIRLSFCPETPDVDFVYLARALRLSVSKLRQLAQ